MRPSFTPFIAILALVSLPVAALALDKDDPFGMVAMPVAGPVEAGGETTVQIEYQVFSADFFIYRERSEVSVDDAAGLTVGEAKFPKGKVKFDKISEEEKEIFGKTFVVEVPVKVPADAAPGVHTLKLISKLQGCNIPENYCLFPETVDPVLEFAIQVGGESGAAAMTAPTESVETAAATDEVDAASGTTAAAGVSTIQAGEFDGPASDACAGTAGDRGASGAAAGAWATDLISGSAGSSFGFFLFLVFLGGIASSLTPCVYPMIPITIAVIGASGDQGRMRAFLMSLVYVGGICATYTVLGFVVGSSGGMFGSLLQNMWVIIGVSMVFVVLSLAMFGVYEFALPESMTTKASQAGGGGFVGAFIVGTVAGVVAAPCTGPVVAFLLVEIANRFTPAQGVIVMLAYSLGLGMLFLAVGTFSGVLAAMPRSGAWMVEVKHVFGVIMLAAAAYYMEQVLPPVVMPFVWMGIVAGFGWVLGGRMALITGPRTPKRLALAAGVVGLGMFMILKPAADVPTEHVTWGDDESAALIAAAAQDRPIILDFTADWCAACKELEHLTYTDPAVVSCAGDFVPVMVDGTEDTPTFSALRQKYGFQGLPAVYFICPGGAVVENLTLKGFEPADKFLSKMNRAIKACEGSKTAVL
jgi:thiol:disulfide interchange protein DsbD